MARFFILTHYNPDLAFNARQSYRGRYPATDPMNKASHHLPLQDLARRMQSGASIPLAEIKATLEEYLLAMASFSLIDVETWFQNILSQMAPICLCDPAADEMTLNLLLDSWYQMGFDNVELVMESIAYMLEMCTDHEYDSHRKQWLESLVMRPNLISKLISNHPCFQGSNN